MPAGDRHAISMDAVEHQMHKRALAVRRTYCERPFHVFWKISRCFETIGVFHTRLYKTAVGFSFPGICAKQDA
jgi:hypothetical protein